MPPRRGPRHPTVLHPRRGKLGPESMDFLIRAPVPSGVTCVWCHEPLRFERGLGWLHEDGKAPKIRVDPDGLELTDHVAVPDFQKAT